MPDMLGLTAIESLAVTALESASFKRQNNGLDPKQFESLLQCALEQDPNCFDVMVERLRSKSTSWEDLCNVYFPKIARELGAQWFGNELSWLDVTLGTARMEALVRSVTPQSEGGKVDALIIVPSAEDHSFGASVLANQLCRDAYNVQMVSGHQVDDLSSLLTQYSASLIGISASSRGTCSVLPKMIEDLRSHQNFSGEILLGGGVLDLDEDLLKLDIDLATNDLSSIKSCLSKAIEGRGV